MTRRVFLALPQVLTREGAERWNEVVRREVEYAEAFNKFFERLDANARNGVIDRRVSRTELERKWVALWKEIDAWQRGA